MAEPLPACVDHDPVNPGIEGFDPTERSARLPGPGHCLLGYVLRFALIAQDVAGQAERATQIRVAPPSEGVVIRNDRRLFDQECVLRRGHPTLPWLPEPSPIRAITAKDDGGRRKVPAMSARGGRLWLGPTGLLPTDDESRFLGRRTDDISPRIRQRCPCSTLRPAVRRPSRSSRLRKRARTSTSQPSCCSTGSIAFMTRPS